MYILSDKTTPTGALLSRGLQETVRAVVNKVARPPHAQAGVGRQVDALATGLEAVGRSELQVIPSVALWLRRDQLSVNGPSRLSDSEAEWTHLPAPTAEARAGGHGESPTSRCLWDVSVGLWPSLLRLPRGCAGAWMPGRKRWVTTRVPGAPCSCGIVGKPGSILLRVSGLKSVDNSTVFGVEHSLYGQGRQGHTQV